MGVFAKVDNKPMRITGHESKYYSSRRTERIRRRVGSARKKREYSVPPSEEIIVISDFVEIRRNNDHMVMVFKSPTKNPKIHISAKDFGHQLDFGVLQQ